MIKPAEHPRSCTVCNGTGWMPGPPIPGHSLGKPFEYSTVIPCTHHWSGDDPDPALFSQDEYLERVTPPS